MKKRARESGATEYSGLKSMNFNRSNQENTELKLIFTKNTFTKV